MECKSYISQRKVAFKTIYKTRKDSSGYIISADSGHGQIRKQVASLYHTGTIMSQICDNKSTSHQRRHR